MDPHSITVYAGAFLLGVGLHLKLFSVGEWDNWSYTLLLTFGAVQVALGVFFQRYQTDVVSEPFRYSFHLVATVIGGIWTSTLIYRAFFHRLGRFPGPFGARLSNFFMTGVNISSFQMYKDMQALHAKYGDIVRVGPTELSIADPKAFSAIYSASSECTRGPWYNVINPTISLQMVRDPVAHSIRRKAWDKAFNIHSIRDYEGRVNGYTDEFLSIIDESARKSEPINVGRWFHFYTFDVMGDLAFGRSFNMLRDGIEHFFFKSTHKNMVLIGAFSRIVWLFPIFKKVPGLNHEYKKFRRWVIKHVEKRIANAPHVPDIFHWIIADYQKNPKPTWQETQNLYGDCALIVVAGSDSTAAGLCCLFHQLCRHPEKYRKLQQEIDEFMADKGDEVLDNHALARLPYLQACIDESLRLYPPVPSGLQRQTPPGGLTIGKGDAAVWIPGETIVQVPSYTMYRDPRVFAKGDEFIPERWTSEPELVRDASVYAPFSIGRFSCVGKQLAMMEIRRTTVLLVHRYDVKFAPDQKPEMFDRKMMDVFTLALPQLKLVFTPR